MKTLFYRVSQMNYTPVVCNRQLVEVTRISSGSTLHITNMHKKPGEKKNIQLFNNKIQLEI